MVSFEGKNILVTGACGTIGSALVEHLLDPDAYSPASVVGIDNDESGLFFLNQRYADDPRAHFFIADVRDRDELVRRMRGMDIVFHTAALKHVTLCEYSPDQAVETNILGVQNVIAAASQNDVERVVFTSSDKAVNPTNVMGTSKLMGERLMTAANAHGGGGRTIFTSTRFGNVLGSNGSVVPVFRGQIASGGPVTLTDRRMTRFVMSVDQAIRLVIDSCMLAKGGEVFITKMPVLRIEDLAKAMIEELAPSYGMKPGDIDLIETGVKPGEKMFEELMNSEETRRAIELERYFVVLPAFRNIYSDISYDYSDMVSDRVDRPYISSDERAMTTDEIRSFLNRDRILLAE